MPKTTTDYHRLPLTDWFYSIEHSKLYPGDWMDGWMGWDISLTPPTTRAPLAVLTNLKNTQPERPKGVKDVIKQA